MGVINYTGNSSAFAKSIGVPGQPITFESYYYDDVTKKSRPYQSTAEVLAYLNTSQSRVGHKTLYVRVGSVLVGGELTGGELREYWFKDGVTNADLVEKNAVLPVVPPFVTLTGSEWNVSKNRRVIINLTKEHTIINTEDFPANVLAEALVKQPAGGGKRLTIDSHEVGMNIVGNRLIGNTRLILEYIDGELVISADPNAIVSKPVLDTQTTGGVVLAGSRTLLYAKFLDLGRTLDYRWKRNGEVPKMADGKTDKHTGQSIYLDGLVENIGSWECTAIDRITGLETPSAPMVFDLGDPEPVYVVSGPSDITVPAGQPFDLAAEFGGTPPPDVVCIEVTGMDGDLPTGPVVGRGSKYTGVALYTKDYAFIGTNEIMEMIETTPAVLDADGFIVTGPVYSNVKTTYKKATGVATVTPDKQEQVAPTGPVVNSVDHTYDFTYVSGITDKALYEFTIDSGTTYADFTAKPIPVPDRDFSKNTVGVRVKETLTHRASPTLYNDVVFMGTPALQDYVTTNGKGLTDNIAVSQSNGATIHSEGSINRSGNTWSNNSVQTDRKVAAGTQVYIETLIEKGGAFDFYYGFKTSPTLGDINSFDVAIGISEFGIITAQSKQNGTQGFGDLLTGDLFRLYRLANGTLKTTYVRDGVEHDIAVVNNVSLPGDLYVCLNLREDTAAKIKNPKTYGLTAA